MLQEEFDLFRQRVARRHPSLVSVHRALGYRRWLAIPKENSPVLVYRPWNGELALPAGRGTIATAQRFYIWVNITQENHTYRDRFDLEEGKQDGGDSFNEDERLQDWLYPVFPEASRYLEEENLRHGLVKNICATDFANVSSSNLNFLLAQCLRVASGAWDPVGSHVRLPKGLSTGGDVKAPVMRRLRLKGIEDKK